MTCSAQPDRRLAPPPPRRDPSDADLTRLIAALSVQRSMSLNSLLRAKPHLRVKRKEPAQ